MPKAVFLMRWTAKRGPVVQGSYPSEADLEKDFLIDVLGSIIQEEEERREGFYPITLEGKDVVTYYSGEELNQVFGILLEEEERGEEYRGGLVQATVRILKKGGSISTTEEWKRLWDWVKAYPDMTREQRIGDAFKDPAMNEILSIITDNGILTMGEMVDRTQIRLPSLSRDVITTYVHILEALDILETQWDDEALEEQVQILRDVIFYRKKPERYEKIVNRIPGYEEDFSSYVEKYKRERMWEQDREVLPDLLRHPEVYKLLKRFRKKGILEKAEITGSYDNVVGKLLEENILGETNAFYYLFTTPTLDLLFPRYTISRVFAKARDGTLSKEKVLDFLDTLKGSYL